MENLRELRRSYMDMPTAERNSKAGADLLAKIREKEKEKPTAVAGKLGTICQPIRGRN